MHIRKLEIHGFKSFPDRQVFHFGPGISGVVGPNGCGKSNVVDAVKWCLGEQSAKSLRGSAMSDVIFAGTQERPSTGLAEVSLVFAAGDEPFPGEYARHAELEVSRRLYRDGKGEYRINGARSRLRDIQDLFLDTGANNRLYSFIEQGRIGQIISARPEQRRALIEEAAGISRFKARKDEAERQLQGTLENVGQAVRTLDELGVRLRSLQRQVRKAVRYRGLKSAIRQGEVFLGLARFAGLVADRRELASQVRDCEAEEASAIREVTRRERNLAQQRAELEQLEGQAGQLRDDLAEFEASRREGESARRYQAKEGKDLLDRVERLRADAQSADDQATAAQARRDEASRAGARLGRRSDALDAELEQARSALQAAEGGLGQRRQRIEAHKDGVLRLVKQVARDRAGLDTARQRVSDLGGRRALLTQRRDQVGAGIDALDAALSHAVAAAARTKQGAAAAVQALRTARQAEGALQQARENLRRDVDTALRSLDQRNQVRAAAERALAGARARRDSLQALQASHAGVDDAVRQVLQVDGTLGTLAEHLDVPQDLERVLTVALGPALDCVLARDDAAAVRAAAAAREGRVSILSLAGVAPAPGPFVARFGGSEAGRKALALLLGACALRTGLEDALAAWRDQGGCVVVDGPQPAFVDQRGLVQRGVDAGAGAALLARRRQLAEASQRLLGLQQAVEDAAAAVDLAAERVGAARAEDAQMTVRFDQAQRAVTTARSAASDAELAVRLADRERLDAERVRDAELARQDRVAQELDSLDGQIAHAIEQVDALGDRLQAAELAQADAESALLAEQALLPADEAGVAALRQRREDLARERALLTERRMALSREELASASAAEQAAKRSAAARQQIVAAQQRVEELASSDVALVAQLAENASSQEKAQSALRRVRAAVDQAKKAIASQDEELHSARDRQQDATAKRAALDRQLGETKSDIVHIRRSLEERHDVSAAGLLDRIDRVGHVVIAGDPVLGSAALLAAQTSPGQPGVSQSAALPGAASQDLRITAALLVDEQALADHLGQLETNRASLERLGEVNLVAQQEYDELHERYRVLDAQRDDLEASVQTIRRTIGRLNRTCRERFRETFDRVSAYFQEIYPRLVGGGRARLLLTDEEDLLQTGVDIVVQPPGKRLQQLSLLSGGEMAMTAIALIFSLFRVKPSPFCLLDEVDAPLDEGNGARFNRTLREMAELSQFIVITHNKKTMECADTLYGVTMVVPGVSRLVSVRLD